MIRTNITDSSEILLMFWTTTLPLAYPNLPTVRHDCAIAWVGNAARLLQMGEDLHLIDDLDVFHFLLGLSSRRSPGLRCCWRRIR